jgi:hypothetical protein
MRALVHAIPAIIVGIAIYFAAFCGFEALQTLSSILFGLGSLARAEFIYTLGRVLGLGPDGLILTAACVGAAQLIVAGTFAIYLFERLVGSTPQKAVETFEAALLLLVILTVAQAVPILTSGSGRIGLHLLNLAVAGLAIVLCRMPQVRSGAV